MKSKSVNLVYFSATNTTKSIVESIIKGISIENVIQYNITKRQKDEVSFDRDDLVIFGFPVYSGRIPAVSKEVLDKFRGKNTPAIIVCVYGNRDYDDALLELRDIVSANGFAVISAGAFIGQHSIFPKVGYNRPDINDKQQAESFGIESIRRLNNIDNINTIPEIKIKGNLPYKIPKSVPLTPKGDKKCDGCGKCVRNCPVEAIDIETPRKTDKSLCIACARCIYVCPQKARNFGGIIYKLVSNRFVKANLQRKEPEVIFI